MTFSSAPLLALALLYTSPTGVRGQQGQVNGAVATLAGTGSSGFVNGVGTEASFYYPSGVAFDSVSGTVFVADTHNSAIRTVASDTGAVATLAGGSHGFVNGVGTEASFYYPMGVALDSSSGTVFVGDRSNHAIRTVAFETGAVATLAGTGSSGFVNGVGTEASFSSPYGVAFDPVSGTVFVADYQNNAVRTVAFDTGPPPPTAVPTAMPTAVPVPAPTISFSPTSVPTAEPTAHDTAEDTAQDTAENTADDTADDTVDDTVDSADGLMTGIFVVGVLAIGVLAAS